MYDADTLLSWTHQLYEWFKAVPRFEKPWQAAVRHSNDQVFLARAQMRLGEVWSELLPNEREAIVDHILAAYCIMRAEGTFSIDPIKYDNVIEEVGFERADAAHIPMPFHAMLHEISGVVTRIVEVYQEAPGANAPPSPEAQRAVDAQRWSGHFLGSSGVTLQKLARMEGVGEMQVADVLGAVLRELQALQAERKALHHVYAFLPTPDMALGTAHLAAQTAEDRYQIFGLLLESFATLYALDNRYNQAPRLQKAVAARIVADAAKLIDGGPGSSLAHFKTLSIEQQERVVDHTRKQLYTTCRHFSHYQTLPDANALTHTLFQPVLNPELGTTAAVGSIHNPFVLESLAHAGSLQRISDRKARRYYATSARAWEAPKSAGGL